MQHRSKYHNIIFICSFLGFLITNNTPILSQWPAMRSDADSLILLGSHYVYNLEFERAEECFREVVARYPDLPAGYFLSAMVEWWKIAVHRDTRQYDEKFLEKINKVIELCDRILDTNEFHLSTLFFKGGALGYRGRFYVTRESWFRAASDGYIAFRILLKTLEIAPNNHDIMLGTGIYNYFAEVLPNMYPTLKPLMVFAPKGDKKLGILQLQAAANNARYAGIEAKFVLLQIFYDFERDIYSAYQIAKELTEKFPNNPVFQRYLGRCYVSMYNLELWEQHWKMMLENYRQKKVGYDLLTAREALYYIGSALMERNQLDEALEYLYKCDEVSRKLDKDGPSPFMIYLNLRIGKIYDLQNKRQYAINQYNKVLSWKNYRDSHEQAKRYLQIPYSR